MTEYSVYKDIAERTQGDVYIGVVGPVRTGKSTFIKKFMELLVLPNIENEYKRNRALDELPQSAGGRMIMTTEPKFIPNEAIEIALDDQTSFNVRLIDCVGYIVDGAMGHMEEDMPRMVMSPWSNVEIPFEQIPSIQKDLISKGYKAGKQVITATQMLESMITNPRPTRAEITDVANAIYDGTSAIMLSGETAAGAHPVEALRTMALIAETTEGQIDYAHRYDPNLITYHKPITNAISHATVTTAHDLGAKAIITVTKTGSTARMISKHRPSCMIVSCTTDRRVCRQMSMSWGVVPLMCEEKNNTDELFDHAVSVALKNGLVKRGDIVVLTAGIPLGISGTTNMIKVDTVR